MKMLFPAHSQDYPRPDGPDLGLAELRPADVLLSRGIGDLSDAIAASDGGSYSHAALWSGTSVIEARPDGVRERALDSERDVYRYQPDGHTLPVDVAERIVARARSKLGAEYAFHELCLLGALFAMGVVPTTSVLRRALEQLGGARAERLERWLDELGATRTPVICTELVAWAYYEASADQSYALRVLPISARPPFPNGHEREISLMSAEDAEALSVLQGACREMVGPYMTERAEAFPNPSAGAVARKVLWGSIAVRDQSGERLGTVTPADLQFSPSLRFLGRTRPRP